MSNRLKNWLEKADDFLERNRRYLRPFGFALYLIVAGIALEYFFVALVSVYALATVVGNQNLQLVVGGISATGTVASAGVAFFLYRNSVRGAEISIAIEDPLEVETVLQIKRTLLPASEIPAGTTQEALERLLFPFEVVFVNSGPKSGAMTDIELKLVNPVSSFPTINNGVPSEDKISLTWEMKVVTRETYRPTPLRSGQLNALSLGSNESLVLIAEVGLMLSDSEIGVRQPQNSWIGIQQRTPFFEFKFQWRTATKGGLKSKQRSFKVRPKFGQPIILGPSVTVP
jgi:hypothetical protein